MSIDGLQCQVDATQKDLNAIAKALVITKILESQNPTNTDNVAELMESKLNTIQKKLELVATKLKIYELKVKAHKQQKNSERKEYEAYMAPQHPPWLS